MDKTGAKTVQQRLLCFKGTAHKLQGGTKRIEPMIRTGVHERNRVNGVYVFEFFAATAVTRNSTFSRFVRRSRPYRIYEKSSSRAREARRN